MIEYNDKKFGRVKVMNVTEARANFASVLGDAGSHYIITKNNKPMRVIISYADYEMLKEGDISKNEDSSSKEPAAVKAKPKRDFPSVKGLLESSLALSHELEEKKKQDKVKKTTPPPIFTKPQPKIEVEPLGEIHEIEDLDDIVPEEVTPEIDVAQASEEITNQPELMDEDFLEEEGGDDYFSASTEDLEEDILMTPEEVDEIRESVAASEQEDFIDEDKEEEPVYTETDAAPKVKRSPEEEAYFQKFKKLYDKQNQGDDEIVSEPIVTKPQQKVAKKEEFAEDISSEDLALDVEPTPERRQPEPEQKPTPVKEKQTASKAADKEELPSLKDLLKELEDEKLSGEEEDHNLDDNEIDDLINRITSD